MAHYNIVLLTYLLTVFIKRSPSVAVITYSTVSQVEYYLNMDERIWNELTHGNSDIYLLWVSNLRRIMTPIFSQFHKEKL